MIKRIAAVVLAVGVVLTFSACTSTDNRNSQLQNSQTKFDNRKAPVVTGDTEYNNYMRAQKFYDDPASIQWCTVFPPSNTAPIYTVPIAGKLTSSSVSFYPGSSVHGDSSHPYITENQSIDGMYHGSPPAYRYGFSPGGAYWDFTNLSVSCTSQLTAFQRQTLKIVTVDPGDTVTSQAHDLLKKGDTAGAQALIDGLTK